MGDEKKQILKMVADGVITAEDGVKLLEALDRGDQRRKEHELRSPRRIQRRIVLDGLGEKLAEIGPMVRTAVCEAIVSTGDDDSEDIMILEEEFDGKFEDFQEPVEPSDESTLFIKNKRGMFKSTGNLLLKGIEGDMLTLTDGKAGIASTDNRHFIEWKTGNLSLEVPSSIIRIHLDLRGASVSTENLSSEIDLKTKGGSIKLDDQRSRFSVKTMGGNISLTLTDSWKGNSRATTMGGNITLILPDSVSAQISATTVGGEIEVDEDIGEVKVSRSHAGSKVRITMGDGEDLDRIKLKTMGGNIAVSEKD